MKFYRLTTLFLLVVVTSLLVLLVISTWGPQRSTAWSKIAVVDHVPVQGRQHQHYENKFNKNAIETTEFAETTEQVPPTVARRKFLLDNEYCLIPNLDPFDTDEMENSHVRCSGRPSITYVEGSYLRFNWTVIRDEYRRDFKYCEYMPVTRGAQRSDFSFGYGEMSDKFDHDILVPPEHEFIRIHCYSKTEGKISTNFHASVTPKPDVEKRSEVLFEKHKIENKPLETFNVHFIGMDSVSRLNFIRRMPKTREFLLNDLRAFEMSGYSKVADNTFVNILPFALGKYVSEIDWNETMRVTFDKYDFFWKNFSRAGYRTMYAEDAPKIAIFVYGKKGFQDPPADYYNRHLQLALERQKSVWNNKHCIVDKLETKYLLDYVTDFSRTFKNKPHFGFTFITRLTHDRAGDLAVADAPYLEFLKRFKREGHFENTILILFSDHGFRFGDKRDSYLGKVEERLPMFFLVFPPKFHEKYPHLVRNLRINSRRLTTPFDVYETVKDILYFDGVDRKGKITDRGISFLREIPKERSCQYAHIKHHWCLCMAEKRMNPASKLARKIGQVSIRIVNKLLSTVMHKCTELTLGNVTNIIKKESNDKVLRYQNVFNDVINKTIVFGDKTKAPVIYEIKFYALPSQALFEATLTYDPEIKTFQLAGDISRINAYGSQSDCIDNFKLKLLCLCK